MREKYCKYCGRDLEFGRCTCDEFVLHANEKDKNINSKNSPSAVCDTCKRKIDADSIYCPYCGLPVKVNSNLTNLQKELRGENAKDVIDVYAKEMKPKDKFLFPLSFVFAISTTTLLIGILFGYIVIPGIKNTLTDFSFRQQAAEENIVTDETNAIAEEESSETEAYTGPRDEWVTEGEDTYAYDIEGNLITNSWVSETDANGIEQNYYFGKDGKLLKDDWVDEDYYVGSDGAMLKNTMTPDGIYVDEDGMAVIPEDNLMTVEEDSNTYYNSPDTNSNVVNNNQTSDSTVKILGVEVGKSYALYIKKATRADDKVVKDNKTCNILYYIPSVEGVDPEEVEKVNTLYQTYFRNDFINQVKGYVSSLPELPETVKFTSIEQKSSEKSNNFIVIVQGKITPKEGGLTEKMKFTFTYNRKKETFRMVNSTN